MKEGNRHTKGAITMTLAAVVLSSGLWALWYTPTTTYEPRKNEQITSASFVLQPGNSTVKTFEVGKGVEELSVGVWPQIIYDTEDSDTNIPPVISAKIVDPEGNVVKAYDNVTTVSDDERIQVKAIGTFKVEVSNSGAENALQVELRATDNSKVPNHPMEALGQWLTVISLPVFGLAGWFVASRHRLASSLA
jgi:hypothetical protein